MFHIEIRLYASLKDKVGQNRIQIELPEPATVATLRAAIIASYPVVADGLRSAIVSVNRNFAADETPIQPTDELAIFPPVSGGSEPFPHPTYFALSATPPDLNTIHAHLRQPEVGAIITFSGYVRGQTQRDGLPTATMHLNYEAYEEMAHEKMAQIAREIWGQWPLVRGIAIVQRLGQLQVGEPTTLVACAAGHRDQGAFEAARYGIDRLKEIVPVWKQEIGADQSVWVEGDYRPTPADNS
jgi:MoaE-MoaD fusion protein